MVRLVSRLIAAVAGSILMLPIAMPAETADNLQARALATLAQIEGQLMLPGLREPVEVLRDRWGVPHIYARNQDDLFFAQGVVAAQDRLFQMDLWRRAARGELAAVLGPSAVEGDRFARLIRYRGDAEAEWNSYAPDARQIITAFTRGINAYIDALGDRWPIEFVVLGFRPEHWQPEDCLGRMAAIVMTRNFRNEVDRARLVAAVGVEKARLLAPTDPVRAFGPAEGVDLGQIGPALLAGYEAATKPLDWGRHPGGSNNWVVDGSLSASGKPLLAGDPHRGMTLPSLRYIVHLNAPGWNVIGGGEPALPGVAIGHNERIAWAFTIVGADQSDIYIEEIDPQNPSRYRVGNGWQPIEARKESLAVHGRAEPLEIELRSTRHGPILYEDASRQRAYALRWVGSEPGAAGYLASLSLDRAQNWQEFRAAAARWKLPAENLVYADVDGNIGWIAAALVPKREASDGLLPVPGAAGAHEWQRFLDLDELPQEFNPAEHFLVTANQNILPPGYLYEIGFEWAPEFRYEQLRRRLEGKSALDLADFQSMQHDNTSLPGRSLAQLIRGLKFSESALREKAELLGRWDGEMAADSAAAAIFAVWWDELLGEFFRTQVPKDLLAAVKSGSGPTVMLAALEKPDKTWFGAHPLVSRDKLLRETFTRSVARLEQLLSSDANTWSWGRLHRLVLRHPLSKLGPAFAEAFDPPSVPAAGDGYTPNQSRYNPHFEHEHGASYRQLFDLADWDRGLATQTPGQSGQPGSPHYADLLPLWERGEYFPLAYSRPKVEEVARHRLLLVPGR